MENAIKIQVPISASYPALEGVLKKQMLGEYIPRQVEGENEPPYAQILGVNMAGADIAGYDIILGLRIRILRTVLKRDQVDLLVYASLAYDNTTQQLAVSKFKLDSRTNSGFFDKSLEVLANKVAYNQILKRARINLKGIISKELKKANGLLADGLELKGLKVMGAVEEVRVQDITAHPDKVSLLLELQGNLEADVFDLVSLMPPK